MKARLLGPLLMMALGAALVGGALVDDPVDVGSITTTTGCSTLGVIDPCTTTTTLDPCGPMVGVMNPCDTTTTEGVTTTVDPCETSAALVVEPCETTTSGVTETTESTVAPSTTAPGEVEGGGVETTDPPVAQPAAVNDGELARTGSEDGPLVAAGITLIVLGAGLALAGRRHRLAERRG